MFADNKASVMTCNVSVQMGPGAVGPTETAILHELGGEETTAMPIGDDSPNMPPIESKGLTDGEREDL